MTHPLPKRRRRRRRRRDTIRCESFSTARLLFYCRASTASFSRISSLCVCVCIVHNEFCRFGRTRRRSRGDGQLTFTRKERTTESGSGPGATHFIDKKRRPKKTRCPRTGRGARRWRSHGRRRGINHHIKQTHEPPKDFGMTDKRWYSDNIFPYSCVCCVLHTHTVYQPDDFEHQQVVSLCYALGVTVVRCCCSSITTSRRRRQLLLLYVILYNTAE